MRVLLPKLVVKALIWLCLEVTLTLLGLDDLADYGEFVFQHRGASVATEIVTSLVV